MTKLLEHQVKEIVAGGGLRVPESVLVSDAASAREAAERLGEVWIKAQVLAGDRAAAGGVVRARTPADAEREAQRLLGSRIHGLPVEHVLVERECTGTWQGYAGISVAEGPGRLVLRFSRAGGAGFDVAEAEVELDVDEARHEFAIRDALVDVGMGSAELVGTARFLRRVVEIAEAWCTHTLELNPILATSDGIVVLDAKADVDDYSASNLPEPELLDTVVLDPRERAARDLQTVDHRGSLRYVQLVSEDAAVSATVSALVAAHAVGGGESLVLFDALASAGLVPANYCDTSGSPSQEKIATAASLVAGQPHVAGMLFSTCVANQDLRVTARGLVEGWGRAGWAKPAVVRFVGNQAEEAQQIVRAWAERHRAVIEVVGESHDEWTAADLLADLLADLVRQSPDELTAAESRRLA